MRGNTLAIYDLESSYANGLMQYISNKQKLPFSAICFTNRQSLFSYLESHHIDILLVSAEVMEEDIANQNIGKIILLSNGVIFSEYMGYSSIFKYQSSEKIIKEVLKYYVDICDGSQLFQMSQEQAQIIGIYSPVSRVGQTTFAITLGQILAEECSVLYFNLEEFSPLGKIFQESQGGDLSDLMYFYKQNPDILPIKLQSVVSSIHNLDYIPPMVFSEDLRNIDTKDWVGMISKAADCTSYEKIIIDISSMIGNIFELLDICDLIYMVTNNEEISNLKVSSYEEYLLKSERENILNKIVKVIPPKIQQSCGEGIYEQQVWGEVGDYIRNIVNSGA